MKKPNVPLSNAVGRALAELAIIVTGVLIALGAQSWWENRGEETERTEAVAAIRQDLVTLSRRVESQILALDSLSRDLEFALSDSSRLGVLPDSTRNRQLFNALFNLHTIDASLPTWDDLVNSGRTGLLPSDVRLLIGSLESLSTQVEVEYGLLVQFQSRDMETALMESLDIERLFARENEGDGGISDGFLAGGGIRNRLSLKQAQVKWLRRYGPQILVTARGVRLALDGTPAEVLRSDSLGERIWLETGARLDSLHGAATGR